MRWSDEAAGKKEIKYPEAGTQVDFEVKNIHPTVNLNQEVLTFKIAFPDYNVSIHFGNNKYDGGREI